MPAGGLKHAPNWPVIWDWIGRWQHGFKIQLPLLVRAQNTTGPVLLQVSVLNVVKSLGIGLPHLNHGAGDRLTVQSAHARVHVTVLALGAVGDVRAERILRRTLDVEWSEDGCFGATLGLAVVLRDHQHR